MDVDEQPPQESVAKMPRGWEINQWRQNRQEFRWDPSNRSLGMPGYNQSLVGSTDQPPSPVMAKENALLDADPDGLGLNQSEAPGAGRPEGSLDRRWSSGRGRPEPRNSAGK